MLQTAWYGSKKKEGCGRWHFEVTLSAEIVYLAVYREKPFSTREVQSLEDFAKKHLISMDSLGVEDMELVAAKLADISGEDTGVLIAAVGQTVMYGILGGIVWLARGEKEGYLADKPTTLTVYAGNLQTGDRLVLGVGNDCGEMIKAMIQKNQGETQTTVPFSGLLLSIQGHQSIEKTLSAEQPAPVRPIYPTPHIYVKNIERKRLGVLVAGLFLLLLVSVTLGWYKRQADVRAEAFSLVYEPALTLLIEAEKEETENPLVARDKLLQAQQSLTQVLGNYDKKSPEFEKLETLINQVNTLYQKISGETKITSAEAYFDLTVVSEGMWGTKMAVGDGWVVVLDTARGLVVGIEVATKQAKILAGGEILTGATFIAASTGKAVVSAGQGLVGVYYGDRKAEKLEDKDETWNEIGALGMFGGNVYLATSAGDIWHYPGFDGGLGERRRWLGPGVIPNLTTISSIAVDGDIWLSTKSGGIMHFRRGAPMNVTLKGLAEPLGELTAIYAEYERQEFWVLDKTNNRLVTFAKDGTYKRQIQWGGLAGVTDMAVITDRDGGSIILLLSGTTIYQIPF